MGKLTDMRAAIARNKSERVKPLATLPVTPPAENPPSPAPATVQPKKTKQPPASRTPQAMDNRHKVKGRLPHRSEFRAVYDAESKTWTGTLTVPTPEADIVTEATEKGIFRLMESLDDLYREAEREQRNGNAAKKPEPSM